MIYERPVLYCPSLKRRAEITALQDRSTIQTGKQYQHPYVGRMMRTLTDPIADGCPYRGHFGIDLNAQTGDPVYAMFSGRLWPTRTSTAGNVLKIVSPNGIEVGYRHLHSYVRKSGWVNQGDLIALSGNTGTATTGAHLHVDVALNDKITDCYPYLFGIWDENGNVLESERPINLDDYEYLLKHDIFYHVDAGGDALNIRRIPSTKGEIVGSLNHDFYFAVDKRCDPPNRQKWARLKGQPWHWVCLFDGEHWLVKD